MKKQDCIAGLDKLRQVVREWSGDDETKSGDVDYFFDVIGSAESAIEVGVCKHGEITDEGMCDACYEESDRAYDAWREDQIRRF